MRETKMASASTLAETNTKRRTSYRKGDNQSRKEKIGEILLCLLADNAQPDTWQIFDQLLRRFYRKRLRHAPQSRQTPDLRGFETVESTNSSERVSGKGVEA
jgi:hypothetical protein